MAVNRIIFNALAILLGYFVLLQESSAAPLTKDLAGKIPHYDLKSDIDKPRCLDSKFAALYAQRKSVPRRSLLATTQLIGAGSQTQIVLTGPIGADTTITDLDFRVFFVDDSDEQQTAKAVAIEGDGRLVADNLSTGEQKVIATKLLLKETGNYLLQVDVPDGVSSRLWYQNKRLIIAACSSNGAQPLLWAETPFILSSVWLPKILGILFAAGLYIFCGTVVFFSRKRLINSAKKAPPAIRVATLQPWPWWRCLNPVAMASDVFDRGSLSKLQILFFSFLVSYGLVYITLRTGELSSISVTVVGLLGISALGSLGAQVAGTTRDRLSSENWAWLVSRGVLPINDPGQGPPRWTDLIMSDSEMDLYKFQALTFSGIVGIGMIIGGFSLATFSVPSELLEVLGLSQLVFVGGRLAKPTTMGDLDQLITDFRDKEDQLRRAAASGVDLDSEGKPIGAPSPNKPFTTLAAAKAADAVPNAARRYLSSADQIKVLLEALSHRAVDTTSFANPTLI